MQNKEIYEFAVIRLVPKVEREEFLNIGVIVFSKRNKYLDIKYKVDTERINAFANDVDTDMISSYLAAWKLICDGKDNGGKIAEFDIAYRFRWLVASRSTIIQSSKTHPGLCDDPQEVLDDLFDSYVL